jgi:hypothetical protein
LENELGRVQIEKDYIDRSKIFFVLIETETGIFAYQSTGNIVKKVLKDKENPSKLTQNEIKEYFTLVEDFDNKDEIVEIPEAKVTKVKGKNKADWYEFKWLDKKKKIGFIDSTPDYNKMIIKQQLSKKQKEEQIRIFNDYKKNNMTPFYTGYLALTLVPVEFFDNLEAVDLLAEKSEFLTGKKGTKESTSSGNKLNTRMRDYVYSGMFTQKDGKPTKENPAPTLFKTKQIRVDNDEIGMLTAFTNNMYALKDPFAKTVWVKKDQKWVNVRPDVLLVNRGLGKSMMDSLGFEQGKILKKIVNQDIGKVIGKKSKREDVMKYRTPQGETVDLSLSEQQLSIVYAALPKYATLEVTTPTGVINFEWKVKDIETNFRTGSLKFIPQKSPVERKHLTSDTLVLSVATRFDMDSVLIQTLAESLHRQGWITYPRVDMGKAEQENFGVKIEEGKDIADFNGSIQEKNILTVIQKANESLEKGFDFIQHGVWQLILGYEEREDNTILSKSTTIYFADLDQEFSHEQFSVKLFKKGISSLKMTEYLINNDIGTSANRVQYLSELEQAGILSLHVENNIKHYTVDQRGFYMKAAYEFLLDNPNSSAIAIGNQIKRSNKVEEIINLLNTFEPVDVSEFTNYVNDKVKEYKEEEKDLRKIAKL